MLPLPEGENSKALEKLSLRLKIIPQPFAADTGNLTIYPRPVHKGSGSHIPLEL